MKRIFAIVTVLLVSGCGNKGSCLSDEMILETALLGEIRGQYVQLCALIERGIVPLYQLESEVIIARELLGEEVDKGSEKDIRKIIAEEYPICEPIVYIDWN